MRNLLVLGVVMGIFFQGGLAKADSHQGNQATQSEAMTDDSGSNTTPNVNEYQDVQVLAEGESEDRSGSMVLETTPSDDKAETPVLVGPIVMGSFGVVMIAVGAGFGWQADQEHKNYNTFPNATEELADDIETHATVANVLMFTGLGVVVGSVIWGVIAGVAKRKERKEKADARLSAKWRPLIAPNQAGVTVEF
ncbi:MAG: hypothetical protein GY762_10680 [Proteobacteria bacterium]|nr:hypothetical protein [Pseudomonadota bacterium]